MRIKILFPVVAATAFCLGQSAWAEPVLRPSYSASDIVSHFAAPPNLGPARALCIGTESECAKNVVAKPKPASNFDLVVNFEYNSATLTKSARANLDEFAKALKDPRLDTSAFVVEGHTDGKGGDTYNLDLSSRRANAVVEYLKDKGVDTAKLEARGYGKLKPLTPDPLAGTNRRVETRLRTE
jgi:outer membrane protein OmpA-like peptidoglycan-associated protein